MGYIPHQEPVSVDHVPAGPRPEQLYPHTSARGTGVDNHDPAGMRPSSVSPRVLTRAAGSHEGDTCPPVDAAGSGPSGTSPPCLEESRRDRRASVPRHVEGAVTVGVTAHGVKRSWAYSERGAGPPGPAG